MVQNVPDYFLNPHRNVATFFPICLSFVYSPHFEKGYIGLVTMHFVQVRLLIFNCYRLHCYRFTATFDLVKQLVLNKDIIYIGLPPLLTDRIFDN